jgi:putative sigma-54 modulation protein
MEVEFTARQVKISKALRTQAEEGTERVARILGKNTRVSITFSAQKLLQIVEMTIQARLLKFAASGKAETQEAALRLAIEHAESQARRHRDRRIESKRLPKEEKELAAPPVTRSKAQSAPPEKGTEEAKPVRSRKKASAAVDVLSFPARKKYVQPHILSSDEAIAQNPLSIEEAVKDAESRDCDLLVFRDLSGNLFVLHRCRDGQMELVEIP